ncbi:YraN family protein [Sedimentibacter sp.]|uniref:YraN family protein n=1 Tax=Sedimentibacter sp. TaxID=1960295 RepID=UPI0028B1D630|nr:YraN family protein [Sedimentibacter sp.]
MYDKNKGFEYEKIAERYLLKNQYSIIERNFISKFGEIDIIALKDDRLHFIEVKGRKNLSFGYPREAVTRLKQKKLISAAKYYFLLTGKDDVPCQFDVIEIIMENRVINMIENAF